MHLSRCVKQILVLHYQVRRGLVGSYKQDLARRLLGMAPHLCTMPWATKAVYTVSVFPSQQGGSVCAGKEELQTHFFGPGRCNVWVNMGHNQFPFPEDDLCFQAPVKH